MGLLLVLVGWEVGFVVGGGRVGSWFCWWWWLGGELGLFLVLVVGWGVWGLGWVGWERP